MEEKILIGFLFDLDGVLIDSEKEYSRLWSKVNEEFPTGIDSFEEKIKGSTLDKILMDYYPDFSIQEKVVERLYQMEATMKYEYKEGADKLLEELKYRHQPMALVTSSNENKMYHLDKELPGLRKMFDVVITADAVTHSKPHPEGYQLAAKSLGCVPSKCVVFEDSLQGVKAGNSAGAYVVGISGTLPGEKLRPFSDMVIDSLIDFDLDDIIDILKGR